MFVAWPFCLPMFFGFYWVPTELLFQTRQRKSKAVAEKALAVEITDTVLPTVSYSKLLGVYFDLHMTWEVPINQISL